MFSFYGIAIFYCFLFYKVCILYKAGYRWSLLLHLPSKEARCGKDKLLFHLAHLVFIVVL